MKNKGFTLIELLAVVMVLGIITTIAVPSINGFLAKSKKEALFATANNLVDTAKQYYMNNVLENDESVSSISLSVTDSSNMELLDYSGKLPSSGYVLVDAAGNIGIAVSQGDYCATKELWDDEVVVSSNSNCEITSIAQMEEINNSCFILNDDKNTIVDYKVTDTNCPKDIVIPAEIGGHEIVAIGDGAFAGNGQLVGLYFDDLESRPYFDIVENASFYNYGPYEMDVIDPNIITTKRCYFKYDEGYDTVPINYVLTSSSPYSGCNISGIGPRLASSEDRIVNIDNSITSAENTNNSNNSISLLPNINAGNDANVQQIVEMENPSVESYGITSVNFSLATNLTSIGTGAFLNNNLTSVEFLSNNVNISYIGAGAFANNSITGILDLSNLSNLKNISPQSFSGNTITNVVFPLGLETIGDYAFIENSISALSLPTSIKSIGLVAFAENNIESLDFTSLPNLTSINAYAFGDNALTTVKLPSSLITIGVDAFDENLSLTTISIEKEYNALTGSPWGASSATVTWTLASKYSISYSGSDITIGDSCLSEGNYFEHCTVKLNPVDSVKTVVGFNLNGTPVIGNSFEMPGYAVTITDVILAEYTTLESSHPYSDSMDQTYTVTIPDATKIRVEFSSDVSLESDCDYIYITDALGNQVGNSSYTGTSLANQVFTLDGNVVNIRLTSDGSVVEYGFLAKVVIAE